MPSMRISSCRHKPGYTPPRLQSQTGGERTLSKRVKAKEKEEEEEEEEVGNLYDASEKDGRCAPIRTDPITDMIQTYTDGEMPQGKISEISIRRSYRNVN